MLKSSVSLGFVLRSAFGFSVLGLRSAKTPTTRSTKNCILLLCLLAVVSASCPCPRTPSPLLPLNSPERSTAHAKNVRPPRNERNCFGGLSKPPKLCGLARVGALFLVCFLVCCAFFGSSAFLFSSHFKGARVFVCVSFLFCPCALLALVATPYIPRLCPRDPHRDFLFCFRLVRAPLLEALRPGAQAQG